MSAATLQALEDAIRTHFESTFGDDTRDERRTAVVVAFTVSNIVEVYGCQVVGFHNEYTSPDSNPNSQVALAQWASDKIADILHPPCDDDE